jgi:hypothetical protein
MEFNRRLTGAGGRILLVPHIVSHYYARSDLRSFCKHNWSNGVWAILPFVYSEVMPVSWRHLVPLVFVVSLIAAIALSVVCPALAWTAVGILFMYTIATCVAAVQIAIRERQSRLLWLMPVVFSLLHFGYGLGSLWASVRLPFLPDTWRRYGRPRGASIQ